MQIVKISQIAQHLDTQTRAFVIAYNYNQFKTWLRLRQVPRTHVHYFYRENDHRGINNEHWIVVMIGYPSNTYLQGLWFNEVDPYFRGLGIHVYEDFPPRRHKHNPNGFMYASPLDVSPDYSRRLAELSTQSKIYQRLVLADWAMTDAESNDPSLQ